KRLVVSLHPNALVERISVCIVIHCVRDSASHTAQEDRAPAYLFPVAICDCCKAVGIDTPKGLIDTGISSCKLLKRVLEKLGQVIEAFVCKAILINLAEMLCNSEIAGSN